MVLYPTTCCKERKVSGFGVQVSAIKKFQISKHKYQTNHNDQSACGGPNNWFLILFEIDNLVKSENFDFY
jgi:hypothetical protein